MTTTPDAVSRSAFCALLELVQKVEETYSTSSDELSSPGPKALAGFLAVRHAEHVQELRTYAAKHTINRRRIARDPAYEVAWTEIRTAMTSAKREVVIAACQLTEHLVVRAYRLVANHLSSHKRALEMLGRHMRDLDATEAFVRTVCSEDIKWIDAPGTEVLLSAPARAGAADADRPTPNRADCGSSLRLTFGKQVPAE